MKGKIKGPDKRTHQDPSPICNILTFNQRTLIEPLIVEKTLTLGHSKGEAVGGGVAGSTGEDTYLEFREMRLVYHMRQEGFEAVPSF